MPIEDEVNDICKRLFTAVQSFDPKTEYEKFIKLWKSVKRVMKNVS